MARILLIDDDDAGRKLACFNLRKAGHTVDEAGSGPAGLERFAAQPAVYELVITDVRMPELSGIDVTERIHATDVDMPVLVITAYGDVETAVQAMRAGAFEFMLKPFSREQLLVVVERALEHRRLKHENAALRRQLAGVERPIVHRSERMRETLALADRAAASDASLLVSGESGTGKELIARRIHARSKRANGPFVAINCAAIPSELLEAELFGHEKGAFTGAVQGRRGRFRQAAGGTLFLDEIGELPLGTQAKLLRVLEERVVDVLGSDTPTAVDVRVVAATNIDLAAAVSDATFRKDLYYRLAVLELSLPPLRERREDIPALLEHFVDELAADRTVEIPEEVVKELERRPWPGNVRELKNACERLLVLSPGSRLSLAVLPASDEPDASGNNEPSPENWLQLPSEGFSLLDLERRVIERVLAHTGGNVSEAARYLRVPRHFLVYRIDKYGIAKHG